MLAKNVVQQCPKYFGVQKISEYFALNMAFKNCSLDSRCSVTDTHAERETHIAMLFTDV